MLEANLISLQVGMNGLDWWVKYNLSQSIVVVFFILDLMKWKIETERKNWKCFRFLRLCSGTPSGNLGRTCDAEWITNKKFYYKAAASFRKAIKSALFASMGFVLIHHIRSRCQSASQMLLSSPGLHGHLVVPCKLFSLPHGPCGPPHSAVLEDTSAIIAAACSAWRQLSLSSSLFVYVVNSFESENNDLVRAAQALEKHRTKKQTHTLLISYCLEIKCS